MMNMKVVLLETKVIEIVNLNVIIRGHTYMMTKMSDLFVLVNDLEDYIWFRI